jgi:hypothetical protein
MKQTTQADRVQQINRCMAEIEACTIELVRGCADPLLALMGQMDWLTELHTQVWGI